MAAREKNRSIKGIPTRFVLFPVWWATPKKNYSDWNLFDPSSKILRNVCGSRSSQISKGSSRAGVFFWIILRTQTTKKICHIQLHMGISISCTSFETVGGWGGAYHAPYLKQFGWNFGCSYQKNNFENIKSNREHSRISKYRWTMPTQILTIPVSQKVVDILFVVH